jgi:Restriction endonuclease
VPSKQRVPYTQQFSPSQTPLSVLLPLLGKYANARRGGELPTALARAFYRGTKDPQHVAGNTIISLRVYGIIDEQNTLTEFGEKMVAAHKTGGLDAAHLLLAQRILLHLQGVLILETLREMKKARIPPKIKTTIPDELNKRGILSSYNSSDLSGVLGWLRAAEVLNRYDIDEERYAKATGAKFETINVLKDLTQQQIAFIRAMIALNVRTWIPYSKICSHAELVYGNEIEYNWSNIPSRVLQPLADRGFLRIRKPKKQDRTTPPGRGGKSIEVKPTKRFETEIAEPLLKPLYAAAGFADVRAIRSKSLNEIVRSLDNTRNMNVRGKALEHLAILLCQSLDLEFMGWRKTDLEVTGGGEIDALFHSTRLIYSRWQVQCKVGPITVEALQKEVGAKEVTLANVILIVGSKGATENARSFRRTIVSKTSLNIILIDGRLLRELIQAPEILGKILRDQAEDALKLKPGVVGLRTAPLKLSDLKQGAPQLPRT